MAAGLLLFVGLILAGVAWVWPQNSPVLRIILILSISGVIFYVAWQVIQLQRELLALRERVDEVEVEAACTGRRSEAIFELSQKFVEANDDRDVLSALLSITVEMVGAVGASVVPLDDRGQPLTAISHGEIPKSLMDSWVEYLAAPEVRHRCGVCQKTGSVVQNCPLVELPVFNQADLAAPASIFCLHLRRGEREYGILNLYLPQDSKPRSGYPRFSANTAG